jgi:hypothetical protein
LKGKCCHEKGAIGEVLSLDFYKTQMMEEEEEEEEEEYVYRRWHQAMLKLKGLCDTDEL